MSLSTPARRRAVRATGAAATFGAVLLAIGLPAGAATAGQATAGSVRSAVAAGAAGSVRPAVAAGAAGTAGSAGSAGARVAARGVPETVNPYSPAYRHPYRHGVVPTLSQLARMRTWVRQHPVVPADSASNLVYGGGISGVGVTTGRAKVYLVFFGSQWGRKGTDRHGNVTLTGDRSGEAMYLQRLLKGLGTDRETWSGVMTQYCDGVPFSAQSCPADSLHVPYPAKGVLAGVWVDEKTAAPKTSNANRLAVEAIRAARHFGNTTGTANRDAQYVILSPTGTHPDGFNTPSGPFCAWHDWNGDGTLSGGAARSPYGPVAFTNLPYLTDAPVICGASFVNPGSPGRLDGLSIVEGHEYAETLTDQFPFGGWSNFQGLEAGDLCAWNSGPGASAADVKLRTGSFAMQPIWSNDANGGTGSCEMSHRTVLNRGIFNGGFETGTFQGWTTHGATSIVSTGVHAGKYAARIGRRTATAGSSSIAQTFTANGTRLSFWYDQSCPDTVARSWATATLTDNSTHRAVTLLARSCVRNSGWKKISSALTAGQSYTLTLTSHDDNDRKARDGSYLLIDDVTIG